MPQKPSSLRAEELCKGYGGRTLWEGFSHRFEEGSLTTLTGPSGCGKTTLLNCLSLVEGMDAGRLLLDGEQITQHHRRRLYRTTFGFLFQSRGLVEQDSVERNLRLSPRLSGLPRKEVVRRIDEALEQVGVLEQKKDPVYQLSGGEYQRVAFARLLVHGARLVFADEPTASLDAENAAQIIQLLREHADGGGIVICATHDPAVRSAADENLDISSCAPRSAAARGAVRAAV